MSILYISNTKKQNSVKKTKYIKSNSIINYILTCLFTDPNLSLITKTNGDLNLITKVGNHQVSGS